MTKWPFLALAPWMAVAAVAQEPVQAGAEKVAFEKRIYPFEGEITAERLNVRMFPRGDGQSIISSVLSAGEKVVVVGEKEDYYQILPPRGASVWVIGRNVRRDGESGVVTADDVPVRLDSRINADAVAVLKEGEAVKIVGENMGWYRISSPPAVPYFVGKKFVRVGRPSEVAGPFVKDEAKKAPAAAPQGDGKARATLAVAESLLEEQVRLIGENRIEQVNLTRVVEALEDADRNATDPSLKTEIRRSLDRYRAIHMVWERGMADIRRVEAEREEKLREVNTPEPAVRKPVMTGHLDTTGLLWKRPGTHKLVMGGKIVCFLRSKDGEDRMTSRFNDLYGKYVGVYGTVIKNPEGWEGYSVVVVDEITPLQNPQ